MLIEFVDKNNRVLFYYKYFTHILKIVLHMRIITALSFGLDVKTSFHRVNLQVQNNKMRFVEFAL